MLFNCNIKFRTIITTHYWTNKVFIIKNRYLYLPLINTKHGISLFGQVRVDYQRLMKIDHCLAIGLWRNEMEIFIPVVLIETDHLVNKSVLAFNFFKAFDLYSCLVNSTIDLRLCTILRFIVWNIKNTDNTGFWGTLVLSHISSLFWFESTLFD